ncbi:unnamed protein product [Closterium sp. NIES-53]
MNIVVPCTRYWWVTHSKHRVQRSSRRLSKMSDCWNAGAIIATVFLPPLGTFMKKECGYEFWISILLTLCFWIPGIIYSAWVVAQQIRVEAMGPMPGH